MGCASAARSARAGAALLAGSLAALACGGAPPVGSTEEESLVASTCPAKLLDANGAACDPGHVCLFSTACGATRQQARCECDGGRLVCVDRVGLIPVGSAQLCAPGAATDRSACPATRADAHGAACPVVGRLCAYRGRACPIAPDVPLLDACRCRPAEGGESRYVCESPLCAPPSD
jgi:hypothetical protein